MDQSVHILQQDLEVLRRAPCVIDALDGIFGDAILAIITLMENFQPRHLVEV